MHILHVDRQRSFTGQTRRVQFVACTLRERGFDVTVIASPGAVWAQRCRDAGIPVHELPMRGPALYLSVARAARLLRGRRVDVIHCHGARDQRFSHMLARMKAVPRLIRTKHNHTPPHGPRSLRFYRSCDHIVTVSEYVRRVLVDAGVDADRVEAIPDAVDLEHLVPRPRDPQRMRSLGLAEGDVVIGNVSSLHERKGIEELLRAYAKLRRGAHGARLKCLLVGKQFARWIPLVKELGIEDGVVFPGFRDDIAGVLSVFDVFVLMSREEALGTSVLEALAMERPVVASDVGGLVESVTDDTGIRVPVGDVDGVVVAVEALLADPERARRLARAGRAHVLAHHSDRVLAERTLAVYERVVRQP